MESYNPYTPSGPLPSPQGEGSGMIHETQAFPINHAYSEQATYAFPNPEPGTNKYYAGTSSPRSRTHSTASSISSFRTSFLEADSPDISACTSHPSFDTGSALQLHSDESGQGFTVEDQNIGRIHVGWDQLIQFLINPHTLAHLTAEHPIAQASYVLASLPGPSLPSTYERGSLHFESDSLEPISAGMQGFTFGSSDASLLESMENELFDPPATAHPFRSKFPRRSLEQHAYSKGNSIDPRSTLSGPGLIQPLVSVFPDTIPPLPIPPARHRRTETSSVATPSRREELRHASSPYARPSLYQQSHLSTSSLQEFAVPAMTSSAASFRSLNETALPLGRSPTHKEVEKKQIRDQLPKNELLETYVWSFQRSRLIRTNPEQERTDAEEAVWDENGEIRMSPMEQLDFPPGSYYRCFEDKKEILPCDSTNRGNSFLRAQHCVLLCNFRFEHKRPSVIRHHVLHCKTRARDWTGPDPIKRLCELQLEAQTVILKYRRPPSIRSDIYASANGAEESDPGDDRSSIHSLDSIDSSSQLSSRRGRRPTSFLAKSDPDPVLINQTGAPEESWAPTPSSSLDDPDWLMSYGLKTPTLQNALAAQQLQRQEVTEVGPPPPRPQPARTASHSRSDSFLAID